MDVLIVGAAPDSEADPDLVGLLAGSADAVVAADGGAASCRRAGIVPDAIVGDFDSLDQESRDVLESEGADIEVHPAAKDETDLDLAVAKARALGADTITVTGVTGGRTDHYLAALGTLLRAADLAPALREVSGTSWLLRAGHHEAQRVDSNGTTFSVVPLGGDATVSVSGAIWPLDHVVLRNLDSTGISNVVAGRHATVSVHSGAVLVVVPAS